PFNPSTTIEFSLPRRSAVSLTIHNILGEKVRTLIDKDLPAGTYTIEWDGTSDRGVDMATGIYPYRIQTESGSLSRKMLLLK
ncbi:MAG: T9SS type A sorting domain-containing protein, partial [candidate division Zixibacteria bacterium]|nr:T9SS type A sorting domain-containing protein [candidate division Zixibacteria bacterium]